MRLSSPLLTSFVRVLVRRESSKSLLKTINSTFGTLPWCRRYLDRIGETGYLLGLNELVNQDIVQDYPPLHDERGSVPMLSGPCRGR